MSLYKSNNKYKIKLLFLISIVFLTIFIFFPKNNWKENLIQKTTPEIRQSQIVKKMVNSQDWEMKKIQTMRMIKNTGKRRDSRLIHFLEEEAPPERSGYSLRYHIQDEVKTNKKDVPGRYIVA